MIKRMLALCTALILLAAGTSYASLAGYYNNARASLPGQNQGNSWVYFYNPATSSQFLYKLDGRYVEAGIVWTLPGWSFKLADVWTVLQGALDRPGQRWMVNATDQWGNPEWSTNDGRLFAKLYWQNGVHTLRICYAQYLTKNGLWRNDRHVPTVKRSKPKKTQPRELLPPVEEQA
jgi:hypothetical protein